MSNPSTLRYTKTHEWARLEGDVCTVGITTFAAEQLTDVTYVDPPHVGDHVFNGQECGTIETVKAVSPLYSPVDGEVIAVNDKVVDDPNTLTRDPLGEGWIFKVRIEKSSALDHLLDAEQYAKQVESEAH
jgi:glycine cleavage system H protein